MTADHPTEQEARAQRALLHFHFVMGHLSSGDVAGANDYLKWVAMRDGQTMHKSVTDMVAVHCHIPPLET